MTRRKRLYWEKRYREKNKVRLRKYRRQYEFKNRKRIRIYQKKYKLWYKKTHPIKYKNEVRRRALKANFGITIYEYKDLLKKQHSKCIICKRTSQQNKKYLAVDHCHINGKVRGLLCSYCNAGLGYFQDSPKLLKKAAKYLCLKS